ncbi:MAG: hypothetical protein KH939_00580 [Firmicutes bacterium]|nr:hypothetical protein [Bacillota bacterium]
MYPQKGATVSHLFALSTDSKDFKISNQFTTDADILLNNLSFSHIREIMVLEDEFERFFYETECINCNWSVRELRRQIKTNLYVRAGISKNPKQLLEITKGNAGDEERLSGIICPGQSDNGYGHLRRKSGHSGQRHI